MNALDNYVSLKPKRTRKFNRDQSEEDRIRRIRGISQGLILKKFRDPTISIEEKYKMAERILLATIKSDKEAQATSSGTNIYIMRPREDKISVMSFERPNGETYSSEAISG